MDINEIVKNKLASRPKKQKKHKDDKCIVYILKMLIGDVDVVKIGITCRDIHDRMVEIQTGFFHKYRYMCFMKPVKFTKAPDYFAVEASLHRYFSDFKYWPEHKFDGSNELFSADPDVVKEVYLDCIDGIDIENTDHYPTAHQFAAITELEKLLGSNDDELPDSFMSEVELESRQKRIDKLISIVDNNEFISHLI